MKKRCLLEFEDKSARATGKRSDGISLSHSGDELIRVFKADEVPFISGNPAGLIALGKILIQIGPSEYSDGYHIHLNENFDAALPEVLIVSVQRSN